MLIDREAAAKVCEEMPCECCWHDDAKIMADTCAAAIRALPPVEPDALAARPDGEALRAAYNDGYATALRIHAKCIAGDYHRGSGGHASGEK